MSNPDPKIIEACSRAAYEVNRVYCQCLGDDSFEPWEHAESWQKESLRNGVPGALAGNTPEQIHNSWLAEKVRNGWKYGPVKDPEKKEHPCMVPYQDLPPEQLAKDDLFLSVVRAVAAALSTR